MKRLLHLLFLAVTAHLSAGGIQDSVTYSKNSRLQWNRAMETIALVAWSGAERVLDVGCGDGKVTALLASKLPQGSVLGIDISQKMIDFAREHYIDCPNLRFELGDGTEIAFEQSFDCIVSFSTLHWILDQDKALGAFYRALAPGGAICLLTYSAFPMSITLIAEKLVRSEKWAAYFPGYQKQRAFFTAGEYYAFVKRAGFEHIQMKESVGDTAFATRQALTDFASPVLNFIGHLPGDLQTEFVDDVVDEIVALAGESSDGNIHYRDFNMQVVARKP